MSVNFNRNMMASSSRRNNSKNSTETFDMLSEYAQSIVEQAGMKAAESQLPNWTDKQADFLLQRQKAIANKYREELAMLYVSLEEKLEESPEEDRADLLADEFKKHHVEDVDDSEGEDGEEEADPAENIVNLAEWVDAKKTNPEAAFESEEVSYDEFAAAYVIAGAGVEDPSKIEDFGGWVEETKKIVEIFRELDAVAFGQFQKLLKAGNREQTIREFDKFIASDYGVAIIYLRGSGGLANKTVDEIIKEMSKVRVKDLMSLYEKSDPASYTKFKALQKSGNMAAALAELNSFKRNQARQLG